ncbi:MULTISPECIES: DinB family protein [Flavobacterium]|uniref:DinB family protein n=1 Tax=Flavobacterium TaxID=237 RepID=UPI0021156CFB|nr:MULTISPECIES: DinB family protein [Flavobacterium]UUF12888.1 DinB family protein [Flavobacterium panici]
MSHFKSDEALLLTTKLYIEAWLLSNRRLHNLIIKLSEEEIYKEISPERNRGIYLLGHLISTTDTMIELLGFDKKRYPELDSIFVSAPDKSGKIFPDFEVLKQNWEKINAVMLEHIENMSPEQWLEKHASVSEDDFKKDPTRNKLNVLISRTNHQNYHLGQLVLLL